MARKVNYLEAGDFLQRQGYAVRENTQVPGASAIMVNDAPLCDEVRQKMRVRLEEYAGRQGAELEPNTLHDALLYLVRRSYRQNRS